MRPAIIPIGSEYTETDLCLSVIREDPAHEVYLATASKRSCDSYLCKPPAEELRNGSEMGSNGMEMGEGSMMSKHRAPAKKEGPSKEANCYFLVAIRRHFRLYTSGLSSFYSLRARFKTADGL